MKSDRVKCAQLIREKLREKYPSNNPPFARFSVTSSNKALGNGTAVTIKWKGKPTMEEVWEVVKKYRSDNTAEWYLPQVEFIDFKRDEIWNQSQL